jgi:hypothetical protein
MTLDQIKRHPYYPFANFRDDDLAFLLLELYWAELLAEVLDGSPHAADWQVQAPADREDGNPVLSVINRHQRPARALRIVQRFNDRGLAALDLEGAQPLQFSGDAYVSFVPDLSQGALDDDGVTPIEELLIASDVSAACETLNRRWLTRWCVALAPQAEMQRELDDYWAAVRTRLVEISPPPAPAA